MMKSCKNCVHYSSDCFCHNLNSPKNNVHYALDLDPIVDEYGELPTQQLEELGWAKLCDYFTEQNEQDTWRTFDKELITMEF